MRSLIRKRNPNAAVQISSLYCFVFSIPFRNLTCGVASFVAQDYSLYSEIA